MLFCVIAAFHAALVLGARATTALPWFTAVYAVVGVLLNLITRGTAERALRALVSIPLLGLVAFVMVSTHREPVVQGHEPHAAHSRSADR